MYSGIVEAQMRDCIVHGDDREEDRQVRLQICGQGCNMTDGNSRGRRQCSYSVLHMFASNSES
jgi:hypothetical protein